MGNDHPNCPKIDGASERSCNHCSTSTYGELDSGLTIPRLRNRKETCGSISLAWLELR